MASDLLASVGDFKAGWLERRKRATLLSGTSWKKGFWVLDSRAVTFREYPNPELAEKQLGTTMEIDPRKLESVEKDSTNTLLVVTKDMKVQLRGASEEDVDDWIFSFEELASMLMQARATVVSTAVQPGETVAETLAAELDNQEFVYEREGSSATASPQVRLSSGASASPMGKKGSSRLLVKVASIRLPMSPLARDSKRSIRADTATSSSPLVGPVSASTSPARSVDAADSPKKSFFEKDMIDTHLFMNKARSLAMSISRGTAESARLKTSSSADTEKPSDRSNRALILPSQIPDETIDPSLYEKTPEQKEMLLNMIKTHLQSVGNNVGLIDSPQSVLDAMYLINLQRGQKMIEQGQPVERLFVLEKGSVGVYSQDYANRPMVLEIVKDKPGEVFGVLPVIHNQPGLFTCKTHSECILWVLSRQKLHEIAAKEARRKAAKNISILERIPLIADNLDRQMINQLADCMHLEDVTQHALIIQKGEPIRRVIIIADGVAETTRNDKRVRLRRGDIFGEWVLLHGARASDALVSSETDLIARTNVRFLSLPVNEVEDLVGPLRTLFMRRWRELRKNDSTVMDGASGSDRSLQAGSTRSLQFGSTRSLHFNNSSSTRHLMESVVINPILSDTNGDDSKEEEEVIRQVTIALRSRETLSINRPAKEARTIATIASQKKEETSDEEDVEEPMGDDDTNLDEPFENKTPPLRKELDLTNLQLKGVLGRGNFGTVHLAEHGVDQFALKVISGEFIVRNGWEYSIENERDAMGEISAMTSPFLLKMFNYFADERNVYFLLELCEGGSLLDLLSQTSSKSISEDVAKFYLANVVLSLEHLHSRNICYRDLKPENVMIAKTGFCKLIDFGLAKKTLRTFTVCGTPEYTAPEVLNRIGHGLAVDWWACGILLYEMTCGTTPFCGLEPMAVYENILAHEHPNDIVYPKTSRIDLVTKKLIADFLSPQKNKRLGVRFPGIRGIKAHEFFTKLDWDALERLTLTPPILSQASSLSDLADSASVDLKSFPEDKSGWTRKFGAGLRLG